MSRSPCVVTWLCVGNYAIHSYINAVLRKSFRHKNISTCLLIVPGKKKKKARFESSPLWIQESFVLEYGGPGRRGLRKCRLLLSTSRMPLAEAVNDTVFGFQEPRLEGN